MHVARLRDEEEVLSAIAGLRDRVDVLVVAAHWSHDFVGRPVQAQRQLARRMIDAGADVIVGTGPHVLQEVARLPSPRGEALVAYSLGNLVSNQGLRYKVGDRVRRDDHPVAMTPGTRDVVLLAVKVASPSPGRVEIQSVDATVFWIANNFWERRLDESVPVDIRLLRLRDVDEALRTERLRIVGETLGPEVTLVP
jgi:poly-gamma-glutamate synthesis protein (capsule biosynthesis protein)